MPKSIELFPTTIFRDTYQDIAELANFFDKLDDVWRSTEKDNQEYMQNGTLCSYNTEPFLHHKFPELKKVVDYIECLAKEYWKQNNFYDKLEPFVLQMWANKTPTGGFVESHLHGSIPFTGVLYVDASPEQGNLVLEHPLEQILMSQPINPIVESPVHKEIEVNTGDIVLFPGYLRHRVLTNRTDRDRLILGFNIGCKGTYWSSQWIHKGE